MKKLLFISSNASRSGAPILLLNLANLLRKTSGAEVDFILLDGGVLEGEFRNIGMVHFLYTKPKSILQKIFYRTIDETNFNLSKINFDSYDAIVANTVVSGYVLPLIRKKFKGKIAWYLHEMKTVTAHLISPIEMKHVAQAADIILFPCETVKRDFLANVNGETPITGLVPYYIPSNDTHRSSNKAEFIAGGCGTVELRKGTDLFIQVARVFRRKYPSAKVKFIWRGAVGGTFEYRILQHDINTLKLDDTVNFQMADGNTAEFYNAISVFLLTSREDPYPLVVLEAAAAEVPSIAFDQSGGAAEFITGNGQLADYLDTEQMADKLYVYYQNNELRKQDGRKALEKVRELHQNESAIAAQFLKVMNFETQR